MAGDVRLLAVQKSSDALAKRLRRHILSGRYAPGEALPTERELTLEAHLSRGSIREALRILEAQGLVETHAGRHGGSMVSRPTNDLLRQQIGVYAKTHGVSIQALIEALAAIEPMVARLAAMHRTDDDLGSLKRIAERLDEAAGGNVRRFLQENVKWHDALAIASHNDLLRAFASSISHLMYDTSRIKNFATADVRAVVSRSHRRILQAIEARDGDAAQRRSERDIKAYANYLMALLKPAAKDLGRMTVPRAQT